MAQKKKKNESKRNEIAGVIIIGFAALTAIAVYFNIASVFGDFIKGLIFGVFGVVGYVIPILLAVIGVLVIIAKKKKTNAGKVTLMVLTGLFAFSLFQLAVISKIYIDQASYTQFLKSSFDLGVNDAAGGGIIGGLLSYWVYKFLGLAGSYVVFIAGIVTFLLILTNLSLKKVGTGIGVAVKSTYDEYRTRAEERREQKRLFVEKLEKEERERRELERESEFNMKVQEFDDSMNEIYERMQAPDDVYEPTGTYDPQRYREVFSGTDIEFEDEIKPEVRSRRKLDPSKTTIDPLKVSHNTKPIPVVHMGELKKSQYVRPPLNLLNKPINENRRSADDLKGKVEILERTLASFNVTAKVVNVSQGPVVTRYEVQPAAGVKVSKIVNLADDIAMNLSARDVRIEAPVPGKPVVGIEIPNNKTSSVGLRELLSDEKFKNEKSPISFALGKDISGGNVYADISRMPHLLIAGATGSGKSVCINALIISMLYHSSPEEVRMIMVDPKVVELNAFNDIPHLMIPVVTDSKKAASALNWAVNEMTMRYRMFAAKGAKDLERYNSVMLAEGGEQLPKLVIIVDELADLMMVAPSEVEDAICRIAQLGRASGIHLVIATQRPSVDVITGLIKANIPSRIAFSVASQIDSRTILDSPGAEKLLGQGDMLFYPTGLPKPVRLQGCFISDKEVEAVTTFLKEHSQAKYDSRVMEGISKDSVSSIGEKSETDELFVKAVELVLEYEQASTSMLQRRLRLGYARAARLIDQLEEAKIISPADGSKPRQVLISKAQFAEMMSGGDDGEPQDGEW